MTQRLLLQPFIGQRSLHCCVGVVHSPARGILQGRPVWTCRLLLTECGVPAAAAAAAAATTASQERLLAQEAYTLRCSGVATVSYCASTLREGDVVHVASKLIHRPRYIQVHMTYFSTTSLVVSDEFGSIVRIATFA